MIYLVNLTCLVGDKPNSLAFRPGSVDMGPAQGPTVTAVHIYAAAVMRDSERYPHSER